MKRISRRKFIEYSGALALYSTTAVGSYASGKEVTDFNRIVLLIKKKYAGKTIRILYPSGCLANIDTIAKKFEKLTGVKCTLIEASLDNISSELIIDSKLSGSAKEIDVAIPATFALADMVEAGAIFELTALSKKYEYKTYRENSLYDNGDYYQGKLYGYQTDGDVYTMFYNKAWLNDSNSRKKYFDQYGFKLNQATTWQELDRQIKFFHNPAAGRYGGSLFRTKNYMHWEFWMRLHANRTFPVSDNFVPQLTSDSSIQALEALVETSDYLDPKTKTNSLFENFKSFGMGNKFCTLGWGGTQKYLLKNVPEQQKDLLFAEAPGVDTPDFNYSTSYFNWGWNFVVSARSKQTELAYLFCLFAGTKEVSSDAVSKVDGFFDPYLSEHYEHKKIKEIYGSDFLQIHKKALVNSIPDFYIRGQGLYFAALKQGVFVANSKKLKPKIALKLVSDKWEQITDKLGRDNQIKQWKFLKSQYPKNVTKAIK